ncbi:hypothetical protein [Thiofilum flexile]|uniref:hypothetical protein n=1 Tax=Thiofilum flexile TaxID=125627 RepID=UPI0003A01F89|nr:hypothetical protein [Thiofilum flexile]
MPKLIIKQSKPLTSLKITLIALLSLILMIAATLLGFRPYQELPTSLLSAADTTAQTQYQTAHAKLSRLVADFNQQFTQKQQGSKHYHEQAVAQTDVILEQLNQLDRIVEQAKLPNETLKTLGATHQYQRDYWDAQRHFQLLRLDRFAEDALLASSQTEVDIPLITKQVIEAEPVASKKFHFATPPSGVNLPAAFCVPGASTCQVP